MGAAHEQLGCADRVLRRCRSTLPPTFGVSQKWLPRSLYNAQNNPLRDFSMDFPNLVPGCNPIHGGVTYLNTSCVVVAPTVPNGVLVGNAGRNRFYGPGLKNVDFSAFTNIRLMERLKLQFRAEFFNVLNHPNLAAPNFLNDANNETGILASTSTPSRQIQLGLKLVW